MGELKRDATAAEDEVAQMTARCDKQSASLFSAPWNEVPLDALVAVPARSLLKRVRDFEAARAKLAVEEEGERGRSLMRLPAAMRPGSARLVAGIGLLAAALGLGVWPALYPTATLSLGGMTIGATAAFTTVVLLGVTGAILIIMRQDAVRRYRQYRRAVADAENQRADRIAALGVRVGRARSAVADLVAELPIAPELLEVPSLDLPAGIERMADLADRLAERKRVLGERRERVESTAAEVRRTRVGRGSRRCGRGARIRCLIGVLRRHSRTRGRRSGSQLAPAAGGPGRGSGPGRGAFAVRDSCPRSQAGGGTGRLGASALAAARCMAPRGGSGWKVREETLNLDG